MAESIGTIPSADADSGTLAATQGSPVTRPAITAAAGIPWDCSRHCRVLRGFQRRTREQIIILLFFFLKKSVRNRCVIELFGDVFLNCQFAPLAFLLV